MLADGGGADVAIYLTASPCGSGAELACKDDNSAGMPEQFSLLNVAAGDYYLWVDGFNQYDLTATLQ